MTFIITGDVAKRVRDHALRAYPEECCGILVGTFRSERRAEQAIEARNAHSESRVNRYTVDPAEFVKADLEARARNLEIVGFYHSHPNAPAAPSIYDLKHAWGGYVYLIISVADGRAGEVAAWSLNEDRSKFNQEELIVRGGNG